MHEETRMPARLRASLADAGWAVRDRAGEVAGTILDVVRWPFERIAWAFERGLVWPLRERTAEWGRPARAAGLVAIAAIAVGAGAIGVSLAGSGEDETPLARADTPPPTGLPFAEETPEEPSEPALRGAAPVFVPREGIGSAAATGGAPASAGAATDSDPAASGSEAEAVPAGPAAMKVARRFAEAFVLYEIGEEKGRAKRTFGETATPRLARSLADRPPQLPASAKVPKAKVLNVVPGPRRGRTYTVSVSLLRVGVTSELRLDLKRNKDSWAVTNVRG
jgi:hypothetical protein